MKTFFNLTGPYEGLRARRQAQCGRLVLYQIINDPPPYWFVVIKNFNPDRDLVLVGQKWGNGTWRFTERGRAQAKFEELAKLSIFIAEALKAEKSREESRQRLLAAGLSFPKMENPPSALKITESTPNF